MQVPLINVQEIPAEGTKTVEFFGREVLVFMAEGNPRAIMNACLHIGGPLEQQGCEFVCQWHQAKYDVGTGKRTDGPAPKDARLMYIPTRVLDGVLTYVYGE
ncbi:MAG: Rieske (2Fe-2S) protein [Chloroflexi bacterium]|nr:Rieske (2Fe-2S) protein [Chloroflexota bacterium]